MAAVDPLQLHDTAKPVGRPFTIAAFACAAVGLFFVFTCPIGMVLSGVAMVKHDRLGKWALVSNVAVWVGVVLVVGLAIGLGSRP